jgi:hypothetical protein
VGKALSMMKRLMAFCHKHQSPSRRKQSGKHLHGCMAVHTGWHDDTRPRNPAPWSAVEHQPDEVPGCKVAVVPWHVIDVCMTVI